MPGHTIQERLIKRIRRSDAAQFAILSRQEKMNIAAKEERDKQVKVVQQKPKTLKQLQAERKRIGGPKEKAARLRQVEERVKREEERRRRLREGKSPLGFDR